MPKDVSIEVGEIKFTGAKVMLVITVLSTVAGGLWGSFIFAKDYMDMKQQIQEYVAPDLSSIDAHISIINEKMKSVEDLVIQGNDYTRDIKNDLKDDIHRIEKVTAEVDTRIKQIQTDIDISIREIELINRQTERDVRESIRDIEKRVEADIRRLRTDVIEKLANK